MRKVSTVEDILKLNQSKYFWIERDIDNVTFGDKESFMSNDTNLDELTFDIGNNRTLLNMDVNGTIKKMTLFRDTYRVNEGLQNGAWPGVWLHKDFMAFGEYSFKVKVDGEIIDIANIFPYTEGWNSRTGLIDTIFPFTTLSSDELKITLICFSPILDNGKTRPSGGIYSCYVENITGKSVECEIILPEQFQTRQRRSATEQADGIIDWNVFRGDDFEIFLLESNEDVLSVNKTIKPNSSFFVPVGICMSGSDFLDVVNEKGVIGCFNETWDYLRGLTGILTVDKDDYFGEYYDRNLLHNLFCISMDQNGDISGANWGTFPSHFHIWIKDMYYSCLPIATCDPTLFEKIILWFEKYGTRHKGHMSKGGATHATSLSVASPIMAGIYYDLTGNDEFFKTNFHLLLAYEKTIKEILDSRIDDNIYLYSSEFLSDGICYGDWHVGTNVCVWRALKSLSAIFDGVFKDKEKANYYNDLAEKTHADIEKYCQSTTKHGTHYNEGYFADGREPVLLSDGEESDTTLMPYYGYCDKMNEKYLNFMRFAMSPENVAYNEKLRCIRWANDPYNYFAVNATAPGYLNGIACICDEKDFYDKEGYFQNLRRVTDADGVIWWWPYHYSKYSHYDAPRRGAKSTAKAGWATGVISVLLLERFLGINYHSKTKTLSINPTAINAFSWEKFSIGNTKFSLRFDNGKLTLNNLNNFDVEVKFGINKAVVGKNSEISMNLA